MTAKFIDILNKAYKKGGVIQVPFILDNGIIKNIDFFHIFKYLDDEPITVVDKTNTSLVLEITNKGIHNILNHVKGIVE